VNCSFVRFLFAPVLLEFFLCWSRGIVNFDYILFCKTKTKFNIYILVFAGRLSLENPIILLITKFCIPSIQVQAV
jgi:hypothetical protein